MQDLAFKWRTGVDPAAMTKRQGDGAAKRSSHAPAATPRDPPRAASDEPSGEVAVRQPSVPPALAKMLDLAYFHKNGWKRRVCPTCGDAFWTADRERTLCGDSSCVEYDFIGNPLTSEPLTVAQMREAFLSFWEQKSHTRVPRNPVVARWRDDLYLNIASIANYQPHVTSGDVPPPANPLVVSQPCIRLNDLANIGRSGRHFACFEMMGHHAFNSSEWGRHYWTEECVAWGHRFLTETLGLDGVRITYKESMWYGGGNAGPCLEVFAGGLEVATLVFMCLEQIDEDQAVKLRAERHDVFEVKGDPYRMMDLQIIDTGWGLERLAWASTGTPTAYDTVFPDTIAELRGRATVPIADDDRAKMLVAEHARVQGVLNLDIGTRLDKLRDEVVRRLAGRGVETDADELRSVMEPIESMYALADHLRCLSFMVGDGIVPSNVKAGYLMRLVFRRAIRFRERLGIADSLADLLADNMARMVDEFPEFEKAIERAREIGRLEEERYVESRDRGLRLVERTLAKRRSLSTEDLVELYDTHGLGPNTVAEAAARLGVTVDVPDTFDAIVAERHAREKTAKEPSLGIPRELPLTRRIFYEEEGAQEEKFDARVTWVGRDGDHQIVILDQTCFFHETGGQPGDQGILKRVSEDGEETVVRVFRTTKDHEHPVHHIEGELSVDDEVHGTVDWNLRMDHTRSHTATHIMNQSVRRVLGSHSWQAGTQKYADCARVDMTHFRRPTPEELHAIEHLANRIVMEDRRVTATWFRRDEAERKYGLTLLQGGIPKGRKVRVVAIEGRDPESPWDVEYCGGTHCGATSEVGPIKLYRTERIQDGIERFEYAAGHHGVDRWQSDERLLREAAAELQVAPSELPAAARRFFAEWKEQRKLLDEVRQQLAGLRASAAAGEAETVAGVRIVVQAGLDAASLQKTAAELVSEPNTVALLAAVPDGGPVRLLFGRSSDIDLDMGAIVRDAAAALGGKGGGRPDFAQGAGPDGAKLGDAMQAARDAVAKALA